MTSFQKSISGENVHNSQNKLGDRGTFGFEETPAPGMMPIPMPPVLPNVAYGRMRGGRGFEGGIGNNDFGYSRNPDYDGFDANGYGDDFGNGFRRF